MERGRPRKRSDGTPIGASHRRAESKRSTSAERKAFETLPQGYRPRDAVKKLEQSEMAHLQKQALGQAARFEVLRKEDVDNLSKVSQQVFSVLRLLLIYILTNRQRNSANSMKEPSISATPTHLSAPGAATCNRESASTSARLAWPSLATKPC